MPLPTRDREQWACILADMQREDLMAFLHDLDCTFQLDFTDEYLASLPVEQLRHLAMAALLHHCPHAASA